MHVISKKVECEINLRAIYGEYTEFMLENNGLGPLEVELENSTIKHSNSLASVSFRSLLNRYGLMPRDLICPKDSRQAPANTNLIRDANLSYFISIDKAKSTEIVAGDRNISPFAATNVLLSASSAAWQPKMGLHGSEGNVCFADGSVQRLTQGNLMARLASLTNGPNVALP